jgi:hypothetical protein
MDELPIKSKDIVLQSLYPKRLVLALGEHAEFYIDAKVVLRMLNLMREAKHANEDLEDEELTVQYSKESEDSDLLCMVGFGDFQIQRLTEKEFSKLEKGFAKFFKWAAEYKLPISEPFIYRIK